MFVVAKRNGEIVDFNIQKIRDAIEKAFLACKRETHPSIIDDIAHKVAASFSLKIQDGVVTVEDIQDSVEEILIKYEYVDVAKAYILYRKKHENIRQAKESLLNYKKIVDDYLNVDDVMMRDASVQNYSLRGLMFSNSATIIANYWLTEIYDEEIENAHKNQELYINKLNMLCATDYVWSPISVIENGITGFQGNIQISPPNTLLNFTTNMLYFINIMKNEWGGSQTINSFDTYVASYVKSQNLSYEELKQCLKIFVETINVSTNTSIRDNIVKLVLDMIPPKELVNENVIIGKNKCDFTYISLEKEMKLVRTALFEIMSKGDANGIPFVFPHILIDKNKEQIILDDINIRKNYEKINKECIEILDENVKSIIGTVYLNIPRISYLSNNYDEFLTRINRLLDIAVRALKIKKNTIDRFLDTGLYVYTKRVLKSFNNCYSALGIVGLKEATLNARWLKNAKNEDIENFYYDIKNHIIDKLSAYENKYGEKYLCITKDENEVGKIFAKSDKDKFPKILVSYKEGIPYYSNEKVSENEHKNDNNQYNNQDKNNEINVISNNKILQKEEINTTDTNIDVNINSNEEHTNTVNINSNEEHTNTVNINKPNIIENDINETSNNETNVTEINTKETNNNYNITEINTDENEYLSNDTNVDLNTTIENHYEINIDELVEQMEEAKNIKEEPKEVAQEEQKEEPQEVSQEVLKQSNEVVKLDHNNTFDTKSLEYINNTYEYNEEISANVYKQIDDVFKTHTTQIAGIYEDENNSDDYEFNVDLEEEPVIMNEVANDFAKLFITPNCSNCKKAMELLDMASVKYQTINTNISQSECEKYGVMQAPTLVIMEKDTVEKYVNLSNIIKYVEKTTLV